MQLATLIEVAEVSFIQGKFCPMQKKTANNVVTENRNRFYLLQLLQQLMSQVLKYFGHCKKRYIILFIVELA